jgi:hypothetical protein
MRRRPCGAVRARSRDSAQMRLVVAIRASLECALPCRTEFRRPTLFGWAHRGDVGEGEGALEIGAPIARSQSPTREAGGLQLQVDG